MSVWLKQSTVATLSIGPFVQTDFLGMATNLTLSQGDIRLSKSGGVWAQKNESTTSSHQERGYYAVPLDATDTNTLGRLKLAVAESGSLFVWQDFLVVAANIYDSLIGGGDTLNTDVTQWNGTNVSTPLTAGVPRVDLQLVGGIVVASNVAQLGVNVVAWVNTAAVASNLAIQTTVAKTTQVTGFNDPTAVQIRQEMDTNSVDLDAIIANASSIAGRLPTTLTGSGYIKADVLAWSGLASVASNIAIQVGLAKASQLLNFNDLSTSFVRTEIVGALTLDTYAEPGQGAPLATTTIERKNAYMYKAFRNKITQGATNLSLFADDGSTVDQKAIVSDDGSVYTRGEFGTGA